MKSERDQSDRMQWTVESRADAVDFAGPIWDAIATSGGRSNPMLTSVAVNHLVRRFGTGSPTLASLKRGDIVLALAVLERTGPARWQVFAPSQAPLPLLVARPGFALAGHAGALLREIGCCAALLDVPKHDEESVQTVTSDGGSVHAIEWGTTIAIRNAGDFDTYWNARPKSLRHNIRRYVRRAEDEAGGVQLHLIGEPAEVSAAVARYGLLESDGWKGREGTALHPDNVQGRFYADLLYDFAALGRARIYELYIGGTLAASDLMVQSNDMLVALKTTYRESMRLFAPGRLVNYYLLKDVMAKPEPAIIEYFTRADADKIEWATDTRTLSDITIYRNSTVRRIASLRRWIKKIGVGPRRKAAT